MYAIRSYYAVKDYDELRDALEQYDVGQSVTLTLLRDTGNADVQVPLEAMN